MIHSVSDTITLHTGNSVPGYGFGTGGLRDDTLHAVRDALADGYRSIDSGQRYGNERDIGLAVAQSGISRKDITLSTKWCAPFQVDYGALEIPSVQEIVETLKESVVRLNNGRGVDHGGYIDLVLLHHAGPNREWRERGWKALSEAWEAGWVRDIGVSNFGIKQLESLSAPKPAICQLELNPWIQQKEVVKYCQERGIVVQAYCPTARYQADRIEHHVVLGLSNRYK
uniref:NADP-dependent oxidoreductase domain-containing protein n=1 Tax=Kwoniella bestiolae CBS 10118 TaxID=1296100 RepID=A0A1B9FV96_9TREE|nr:hypothetical protein I302_08344 [Kwoniella bestiolae CBS 10118]OCF22693.1 hypothetical protein I302_08344 [Kwoniella bestiolae CBS 10118]